VNYSRIAIGTRTCNAEELFVLLALADHLNDGVKNPRLSELARHAEVPEAKTRRVLRDLVADGRLTKSGRKYSFGGGA